MPTSARSSQTEFVASEFRTSFSKADVEGVVKVLSESIEQLLSQMDDDDVEELLRSEPSASSKLTASDTRGRLQPEPFTQDALIKPLLEELGYDTNPEAGTLSDSRGQQADYSVSLRQHHDIDSSRLLIEAEPLNKKLDSRGHGINQVESWLKQRDFESDFGYATDGLRWIFVRYDPDSYNHNRISEVDLSEITLTLFESITAEETPSTATLTNDQREVIEQFVQVFKYENFIAIASDAHQIIRETQKEITDDFYEDYIQIVFGVVRGGEDRAARSLIHDGVVSPPSASQEETRLFAVKVMNRLMFVKFLEDKHIVEPDLLEIFKTTYKTGVYPDSLYETFIQKLFYDVMNTHPENRSTQIDNIDLFSEIPYLNGGLFRPYLDVKNEIDEREFDVKDSVLISIIDLLEEYRFSADGGPTDLDPSVLGNVFEKTINYLTTDSGDQNKELGAYYTPSEITRFCAEETIRPGLRDKFQEVLKEEHGWEDDRFNGVETVYDLIDEVDDSMKVIGTLLDEINQFRVVDPAVGSGHFLTSVMEEIAGIRKALYARAQSFPHEYRLKKTTVQNNIYGVDIVGPAVEIAKLRCWLSIISELSEEEVDQFDVNELALPNIAFNIRQGNSLIGYTGFPDTTDDGQIHTLTSFTEDSVRSRYKDIISEINKYQKSGQEGFPEKAEHHRERAFQKLDNARRELLPAIHGEFVNAGIKDITTEDIAELIPFNWVLEFAEVYADGGFDVIVGNPPWDVLEPNREEYFSRHDKLFRSRGPSHKDRKQDELLEDAEIADGWEQHKRKARIRSSYFNKSEQYKFQDPKIDGNSVGPKNDLSMLFLERAFEVASDDSYVAQILPGTVFVGAAGKDLRNHLLDETTLQNLVMYENKGIFPEIDNRYKFGISVFKNAGKTEDFKTIYRKGELDILRDIENRAITVSRKILTEYSPKAGIFPLIQSARQAQLLSNYIEHPPLSDDSKGWRIKPRQEINRSSDRDRYVESEEEGDYPVLGGSNIYQYNYTPDFIEDLEPPTLWSVAEDKDPNKSAKRRIREKSLRSRDPEMSIKKAIYNKFNGTGSQKAFVNDILEETRGSPLSLDDVKLDCEEYRIVFRNITNSTNERTLICAAIPKGVVCHHAINTIRTYEISINSEDLAEDPLRSVYKPVFTDDELFVALGLLNSIPFDYLMRTKIEENLVMYKLTESQVPRLTEGDEWFEYISTRAARLNCYGEEFKEMRDRLGEIDPVNNPDQRKDLQAEIDAASFHAYGFNREEAKFILDDFYRVNNPRIMTDEYFSKVLGLYDDLASYEH